MVSSAPSTPRDFAAASSGFVPGSLSLSLSLSLVKHVRPAEWNEAREKFHVPSINVPTVGSARLGTVVRAWAPFVHPSWIISWWESIDSTENNKAERERHPHRRCSTILAGDRGRSIEPRSLVRGRTLSGNQWDYVLTRIVCWRCASRALKQKEEKDGN